MRIPFSQRYGYTKPEVVLIREDLSGAVLNAVLNCYTDFYNKRCFPFNLYTGVNHLFHKEYINLRYDEEGPTIEDYIEDITIPWYSRLDVIEWHIAMCRELSSKETDKLRLEKLIDTINDFVKSLNNEFERLNYGYRIISDCFVETTSESELSAITEAISKSDHNVVTHLQECLKLLSPSNQELSTRNSIKEAISAVEVIARRVTDTNTLDDAFKKLKKVHPMIKLSMEKLYHYTNQKDTGIRHGWMNQEEEPTVDEAIFILVTSCSFINYLNKLYS